MRLLDHLRELLARAVDGLAPSAAEATETIRGLETWVADIRRHLAHPR